MAKRAYKLQEFVAHSSNVNCLKIGKKSSRVLVTGGDDHKVNMWAIGKPNAILSLSGHSSAVESVVFDATEGLVVAGAASGTIKLWDLEEAKVVRTLTGHRSNCVSVDYHPFGEFFASGSLDTNLKIWDIRRKGCIHTYKGHTRGINVLKFSPDGRWVVSGAEDNTVKLWDLTAGKLMHDFKSHEGQIQCLDFHPHEFLLATGSADRTVKFWDLETFELIGSGGPETSGVRAMAFNPDGRTLLSGLHESLKVFSWEPIRCHDAVDIGWSKLADLNVHEGKLLGCSFNQSCVGIWVVDLSRLGPSAAGNVPPANKLTVEVLKSNGHSGAQQLGDATGKNVKVMRPSSHGTELGLQDPKITPSAAKTESAAKTFQRDGPTFAVKIVTESSAPPTHVMPSRKSTSSRGQSIMNTQPVGRMDVVPVIVPRNSVGDAMARNVVKEVNNGRRTASCTVSSKVNETMTSTSGRDDSGRAEMSNQSASMFQKHTVSNERIDQNLISRQDARITDSAAVDEIQGCVEWVGSTKFRRKTPLVSNGDTHRRGNNLSWPSLPGFSIADNDGCEVRMDRQVIAAEAAISAKVQHGRGCVVNASEEKKKNMGMDKPETINTCLKKTSGLDISSFIPKGGQVDSERVCRSLDDLDVIESITQQHFKFTSILQSRLTKLQAIRTFWEKTDLKGALEAIGKMGDHSVLVDIISVLNERNTVFTLEICAVILPLLTDLLKSEINRYLNVALGTLLVLVRSFGDVIFATRNASPSVGVNIQAEERRERCNQCYRELEKVKQCLAPLMRRSGPVAKSAQELRIILQDV